MPPVRVEVERRVGLGTDEHAARDRRRRTRRPPVAPSVIDDEAELRRRDAEQAVRRCDPKVARNDELRACAQRRTVDRCNYRRREHGGSCSTDPRSVAN